MSDDALPYAEVLSRIAELAEALAGHPDPVVAAQLGELLDWIDAFHRDGLGRLVEMIRAWRGEVFLESVDQDEVVGLLLGAYGLGEARPTHAEAEASVATALDSVRSLAASHGGSIEVATVRDGVVAVRLLGTCDGCPSSTATLVYGVEAALREQWPHFRRLEVLDEPAAPDPAKAELECVTLPSHADWQPIELRGGRGGQPGP